MNYYRQCTMIKNNNTVYIAYIPIKYACLYNKIQLKFGDVWEDGWVIFQMGEKVSEDNLPNTHKQIKEHRKKTGDSLPKNA